MAALGGGRRDERRGGLRGVRGGGRVIVTTMGVVTCDVVVARRTRSAATKPAFRVCRGRRTVGRLMCGLFGGGDGHRAVDRSVLLARSCRESRQRVSGQNVGGVITQRALTTVVPRLEYQCGVVLA